MAERLVLHRTTNLVESRATPVPARQPCTGTGRGAALDEIEDLTGIHVDYQGRPG
jgi:hypothetical protein